MVYRGTDQLSTLECGVQTNGSAQYGSVVYRGMDQLSTLEYGVQRNGSAQYWSMVYRGTDQLSTGVWCTEERISSVLKFLLDFIN